MSKIIEIINSFYENFFTYFSKILEKKLKYKRLTNNCFLINIKKKDLYLNTLFELIFENNH